MIQFTYTYGYLLTGIYLFLTLRISRLRLIVNRCLAKLDMLPIKAVTGQWPKHLSAW